MRRPGEIVLVYRREIGELAGEFLADYETRRLRVRLADDEREVLAAVRKCCILAV